MADELHTHYTDTEHDVSTDLVLLRSASFWLLAHANNTLDVCSLELGTIRVERLPFSPSAYAALPSPRLLWLCLDRVLALRRSVQLVVAGAQVAAETRGVQLLTSVASDVPKFVVGDGARTQQVLRVLMALLFQHIQQGDVSLELTCGPRTPSPLGNSPTDARARSSPLRHVSPFASLPSRASGPDGGVPTEPAAAAAAPSPTPPPVSSSNILGRRSSRASVESSSRLVLQFVLSATVSDDRWVLNDFASGSSGVTFRLMAVISF
jgi:hypothetical protein